MRRARFRVDLGPGERIDGRQELTIEITHDGQGRGIATVRPRGRRHTYTIGLDRVARMVVQAAGMLAQRGGR